MHLQPHSKNPKKYVFLVQCHPFQLPIIYFLHATNFPWKRILNTPTPTPTGKISHQGNVMFMKSSFIPKVCWTILWPFNFIPALLSPPRSPKTGSYFAPQVPCFLFENTIAKLILYQDYSFRVFGHLYYNNMLKNK